MSQIYAVSDIHGYGHLLEALLQHVRYRPENDRLFLLGDYVNKGPDSGGTLDYVMKLCDAGAIALQGNNERKWLHLRPEQAGLSASNFKKYQEFIATLPLWTEYEHYLFVHAGIRPNVSIHDQKPEDLTEIREPFHQAPRVFGHTIVFGHTSTFRLGAAPDELWYGDGKLGIDTGAGHGYYISLVNLTAGIQTFISVQQPERIMNRKMSIKAPVNLPISRRPRS
ncbi:metallophosphoesterase family protein [Paenibacillus sp. JCM 10914]|uniref:metallophosphoesterase n=1 Tax=Paenibacillus sp. JCM 10914 TaxID=1236974 RepID=UPI0003CC838D|nr:metallophosphoesterase [Paenibacillus sp. JCM 10914]GAE07102.1 putative serine/threonine protein phosphatase [Paenibacillus sp. JCM 10914]